MCRDCAGRPMMQRPAVHCINNLRSSNMGASDAEAAWLATASNGSLHYQEKADERLAFLP